MAKKKSAFGKTYRGFFSTSENTFIRASKNVNRIPVGNPRRLTNILKDNQRGRLKVFARDVSWNGTALTKINGNEFVAHLKALTQHFNSSLWMFIQALGSHTHLYFQQAFDNQSLGPGTHRWASLSQKTRNNRVYLGFPARGKLMVTGRLKSSLKIEPSSRGVNSVLIYVDKKAFAAPYPEFIGSHRRKATYKSNVGPAVDANGNPLYVKGKPLYGRKGRFYAPYHLSKNGNMFRPYMGANVPGIVKDPRVLSLMDDILFYGVFNKALGFGTHK